MFDPPGAGQGLAYYAAAVLTSSEGVTTRGIAKWDGTAWQPQGEGVLDGMYPTVADLAVFDDGHGEGLYVGGTFSAVDGVPAGNIAKWDGYRWTPLGLGTDGPIYRLTVFDDGGGPALYAAGYFLKAGGVVANSIAKWDGQTWSPLGTGLVDGSYYARAYDMAVFDDGAGPALYVAGTFNTAGGVTVRRLAKWDGVTWLPVGGGLSDSRSLFAAYALAVYDPPGPDEGPALYVGGAFSWAGGSYANCIAKWDGQAWFNVGAKVSGSANVYPDPSDFYTEIRSLSVFDDGDGPALYVGGNFLFAGQERTDMIARWDGASWSSLGIGFWGIDYQFTGVFNLTAFDDGASPVLVAGGGFKSVNGKPSQYIAMWRRIGAVRWLRQPSRQIAGLGQQATFTADAEGAAPLTYQWYKDEIPLADGDAISGATTSTLVIDAVMSEDAGLYHVTVTNPCGAATSQTAALIVTQGSPQLVWAHSVAAHKVAPASWQEFHLDLDLGAETIEPRASGLRILEFQFDRDALEARVTVVGPDGMVVRDAPLALRTGVHGAASLGRVEFESPLPDRTMYQLIVTATTGAGGDLVREICAGALAGDFNGDGRVTMPDRAALTSMMFQPVSQTNALYDLQPAFNDLGAVSVRDLGAWMGFFGNIIEENPLCTASQQ